MTTRHRSQKKNAYALVYDIIIIAIGIAVTLILSKMGFVDSIIEEFKSHAILATFVAGIFFTSTFTIAPASIALDRLAHHVPLPTLAFWGALGAMVGDLVLFFCVRDRFAEDLKNAFKPSTIKKISQSFHFGFLRWISPLVGALLIASPLPDEFGITLLGMSKVKLFWFIPITFAMNALGIYILILFANLVF